MSSGPVGTGTTCIEVTKRGYVTIYFGIEDWCTYKGECKRYMLPVPADVCLYCKYRQPLDIPSMIDARVKEKENEDNKV